MAAGTQTEKGATGLILTPSAETLDAGNICIGVWTDYRKFANTTLHDEVLTVPASITLGISPFWEIYGSYPNVLLHGEENRLQRGTADVGTKIRFIGSRRSSFKLAADLFLQRFISSDPDVDGITDLGARLVASLKGNHFGMHLYGGRLFPDDLPGHNFRDEFLYGAGLEFKVHQRSKLFLEVDGNTNRERTLGNELEGVVGVQYYLSPHFTLNLSGAKGLSHQSPQWHSIIGFTFCQGVGTYTKPIPKLTQPPTPEKPPEKRPSKIIPLSPLLIESSKDLPQVHLEYSFSGTPELAELSPVGYISLPLHTGIEDPGQWGHHDFGVNGGGDGITVPGSDVSNSRVMGGSNTKGLYGIAIAGVDDSLSAPQKIADPALSIHRRFRLPDSAFDHGLVGLSEEGKKFLAEIGQQIREDRSWQFIRVDGYGDNLGSEDYNLDLSFRRAVAVSTFLVNREGIEPAKIFLEGKGGPSSAVDRTIPEKMMVEWRCEILLLKGN
jgi:hypothetical protein